MSLAAGVLEQTRVPVILIVIPDDRDQQAPTTPRDRLRGEAHRRRNDHGALAQQPHGNRSTDEDRAWPPDETPGPNPAIPGCQDHDAADAFLNQYRAHFNMPNTTESLMKYNIKVKTVSQKLSPKSSVFV
ncbi:MAG: hypothetical protein Q9226_001872 [Calogaya cf. arnoldii]